MESSLPRRFLKHSLIYGIGSVLPGMLGFFLLPIYTAFLSTADYGILAVTEVVERVLGEALILGLGLALQRFYYDYDDRDQLARYLRTIWLFVTSLSLVVTLGLSLWGGVVFNPLFRELQFDPYVKTTLWIVFLSLSSTLPLVLYQVREEPVKYVSLVVSLFVTRVGLVIFFVVGLRAGALGYLQGRLLAALLFFMVFSVVMWRASKPGLSVPGLKQSLGFGLPTVPHTVGGLMLNVSDRVFLERYASLSDAGLYAVGYKFVSLLSFAIVAVRNAWVPLFFAESKAGAPRSTFARTITTYVAGLTFLALGVSLLARQLVALITAPAYHQAYQVIPVLILGYLFYAMYVVSAPGIMFEKKPQYLSVVTVATLGANLLLNFLLVPRLGMMGAALSGLLTYALMFLATHFVSTKLHPLGWENRRIALILATAIGLFVADWLLGLTFGYTRPLLKVALWLSFPLVLWAAGFFTTEEKARLAKVLGSLRPAQFRALIASIRRDTDR